MCECCANKDGGCCGSQEPLCDVSLFSSFFFNFNFLTKIVRVGGVV